MKPYFFIFFLLFLSTKLIAQDNRCVCNVDVDKEFALLSTTTQTVLLDLAYKTDFSLPTSKTILQEVWVTITNDNGEEFELISPQQFTFSCDDNLLSIIDSDLLAFGSTLNIHYTFAGPSIKDQLKDIRTIPPRIIYESSNEDIFGPNPLYDDNIDTIATTSKNIVIYSKKDCELTCLYPNNKPKWSKDLRNLGCQLVYLDNILIHSGKRINGCDIIFQTDDKKVYLINSRNGRMKYFRYQGG